MPTIRIQGIDLPYAEADIITFDEGLIGLPRLRRMVLVQQSDIAPFLWLASLDDPALAFLVVDPHALFPAYAPGTPADVRSRLGAADDAPLTVLAVALVADDWEGSTVNLRAPLFISAGAMRGAQVALTDGPYRVDEPMPFEQEAA